MKRMIFVFIAAAICAVSVQAQTKADIKLYHAIKDNDMKDFASALKNGANPNATIDEKSPRTSPFLKAVALNRYNMVKVLIQYGANINQSRPLDVNTPIMIAARKNYSSILKLLIDAGADINATTIFNRTALQIAALHNSLDAGKILVAQPEMDVNNRGKLCALAVAARQGYAEFVKLLISLDGDKQPSERCYNSAIHMAEFNGHTDILNLLK